MGCRTGPVSSEQPQLDAALALSNRGRKLNDAFRLLDAVDAREYNISLERKGAFHVRVCMETGSGRATGEQLAATILIAVARAIGLDVPDPELVLLTNGSRGRASQRNSHGK